MMKKTAMAVAISLLTMPVLAEMNYDEFMDGVGAAQQQIDYSGRLVKRSELDKWILDSDKGGKPEGGASGSDSSDENKPEAWLPDAMKPEGQSEVGDNANKPPEQAKPAPETADQPKPKPQKAAERAVGEEEGGGAKSNRRQGAERAGGSGGGVETQSGYRGKKPGVTYVFVPDMDADATNTTFEMTRKGPQKTIRYGIPIGSRFRVELRSGASSVQPGLVQVVLLEDVIGNKKTLERGAVLFMQVSAERGSERLFGTVVRGIERNRRDEFTLSGNIYGHDGQPGLIARVISDGRGVDRATDAGLAALGEAAISAIPGNNMGVDAGKKAGSSLLGDEDNKNQTARGAQKLVVQAAPQNAVIEIGETF